MKMKMIKKAFTIFATAAMLLSPFGLASQFAAMEVHAEDGKIALFVLRPEGKDGPTYDGTEHALVVPGIAYGGTMMYAVGESDSIAPVKGWNTEIPTAKNVGTYYIWYYAKGDGVNEDSEKECVETKIHPRGLAFHFLPTYKVKGQEEDPEYNYTVTGLLEGDVVDYTIEREKGEEPGVYAWKVKWPPHPYYDYLALDGPGFVIYESAPIPPTKMNLIGRVVWVDANNAHGERDNYTAEDARPTLYRKSAAYSEEKVELVPTWNGQEFSFNDLDIYDDKNNEWEYRVSAATLEGYLAPECDNAEIRYIPDDGGPASVSGTIRWIDGGKSHDNAGEVNLQIWRRSEKGGTTAENISAYPHLLRPNWDGNSFSFTDLPKRDGEGYLNSYYVINYWGGGNYWEYRGYELPTYSNIDPSIPDRALDGCTLSIRLKGDKTEIGGSIVWEDDEREHENAKEVRLILKRTSGNPGSAGEETVGAVPTWDGDAFTFENLALYDEEGYDYTYWTEAEAIEGYETPKYINIGNFEGVTDRAQDGCSITIRKVSYEAKDAYGNAEETYTWQKGSGKPLDFSIERSEGDDQTYERFEYLDVDGKPVGEELYEKSPGSVNISIKPEYLETLALGDHDIKVNFDDGNSELKLRIIAATEPAEENDPKPTPEPEIKPTTVPDDSKDVTTEKESKGVKTADESNAFLWFALMSASLLALIGGLKVRRRIMR